MTVAELQAKLDELDKGRLYRGSHSPLDMPDLRPLNDGPWSSDEARTEGLLPVMAALWDWSSWTEEKKRQWLGSVILMTIQRLISELPTTNNDIRKLCRSAHDLTTAAEAAWAAEMAESEAAWAAEMAESEAVAGAGAEAAARAAWAAAWAARAAARAEADNVLRQACQIWIEAIPHD